MLSIALHANLLLLEMLMCIASWNIQSAQSNTVSSCVLAHLCQMLSFSLFIFCRSSTLLTVLGTVVASILAFGYVVRTDSISLL